MMNIKPIKKAPQVSYRSAGLRWLIILIVLLIGLTLGFILCKAQQLSQQKPAAIISGQKDWHEHVDILLYLEAITKIKNLHYFLQPERNRQRILEDSLRYYLEKTDPYATYMSASDFSKWKEAQGDDYVGIGMEIVKNKKGEVICLPYYDGPAYKAGIKAGQKLISVGGQPIKGLSVLAIGNLAREQDSPTVTLSVESTNGQQKSFTVKRSKVFFESVKLSWNGGIAILKIAAFTLDTKDKLKQALSEIGTDKPIVLDLRGNAGGDLFAAIDSALLFMEDDKLIVSIKTRQESKQYKSGKKAVNLKSPVFIWQDEGTASAGELFTAALTDNKRAVSIGNTSYGKGTKQEVIELSDGSALFITTGALETPKSFLFDGIGIDPNYPLQSPNTKTEDYLLAVNQLLHITNGN